MFPWLDGVLAAARRAGALGAALSGAGPSVLGVAPAGKGAGVSRALVEALTAAGHPGRGHVLGADTRGAHVERLPE
jgi:homoserine kinase